MVCLFYVPSREVIRAGEVGETRHHLKGWDVNEGVKREKERKNIKKEKISILGGTQIES